MKRIASPIKRSVSVKRSPEKRLNSPEKKWMMKRETSSHTPERSSVSPSKERPESKWIT